MSSGLISVPFHKVLLELKICQAVKSVHTFATQRIKESQWYGTESFPAGSHYWHCRFTHQGAGPHPRQNLLAALQVVDCNLDLRLVYQK